MVNASGALLGSVRYAARKHRQEQDRMIAAALVAYEAGVSVNAIAEAAGVHRSSVYRWLADRARGEAPGGGSDH